MNAKHLIAAVAVLASSSALADTTYPYVEHTHFTGTKIRAQVQAELNGAGTIVSRQQEFSEHTKVASGKTRAEVRAELEHLYAEGNHIANRTPEFVEFTHVATTRSRAEVRAEAIRHAPGAMSGGTSSGS